ncbi:MAG: Gfo/Idh/MocA family oxidoreductase [Nitrososphaerota archaeon]|nr:Gfo/Idh/MocA family oxidoreductase [Candidatus Calditenuaceae archaeon]MDW8073755.1 Gfo/Idh/MocA family oxidoreductase [Nitrososphaerota archaeon]
MKKVRFGIIGAGGISNHFHIPELTKIEEAEVVAVADINRERARMTSERFSIRHCYTDYREMLMREDIDAVIVATPHPTHAQITVEAIKNHKHVMIQKPMTTNSRDSAWIVEEARKNPDLKVMVLPFVYYDTPIYDHVKSVLRNGEIGKVCMAEARTSHGGPEKYMQEVAQMFGEEVNVWFFSAEKAQGGVLLDLGVYSLTRLVYLLGRAKKVSALVATLDKSSEVDDNNAVLIEMESGVIAVAESSWTQTPGQNTTSLYGTKGTIHLNYLGYDIAIFKEPSGWAYPNMPKEKEPQHTHRHFINCIVNDTTPIGTPEEGHHVMRIIEAAYESAKYGRIITI